MKDLIITKENCKDFKKLKECGNIDLRQGATLKTKLTKKLDYKSVDNKMFVILHEKPTKGIRILTGYNLISFENKIIKKEACYVAEKDGVFAHGLTIKKAIGDLNFKIISEKLKKDPIKKDTKFTVKYYRLLTGACDFGVRSFMEQNKIAFEIIGDETVELKPIKAIDLLPILEKNNA